VRVLESFASASCHAQGPSILEMLVMAGIFVTAYDSPRSSMALVVCFVAYFVTTIAITKYRNTLRASVNKSDNNANQVQRRPLRCRVLHPSHHTPPIAPHTVAPDSGGLFDGV